MLNRFKKEVERFISILLLSDDKRKLIGIVIMMIIIALLEVIGIGLILPYMSLLSDHDYLVNNKILLYIYDGIGFGSLHIFNQFIGVSIFIFILASSIFRAKGNSYQIRYFLFKEHVIAKNLFRIYLNNKYAWYLNVNSSDLSKTVLSEVGTFVYGILMPIATIVSQFFVIFFLLAMLIYLNPFIAISSIISIATVYSLIVFFFSRKLSEMGSLRLNANAHRFKIVNESIGSFKEIKINSLESQVVEEFSVFSRNYAEYQSKSQIISITPRFLLETLAYGGVVLVLLVLLSNDNSRLVDSIPLIALYALAGFRLLPALQQIYGNLTKIKFSLPVLSLLSNQLHVNKIDNNFNKYDKFDFNHDLVLKNIVFGYDKSKDTLQNINLSIAKGSHLGIVGPSGSGKSTLVDVITGLIIPQRGELLIDGVTINESNIKSWQGLIGYVSQNIFLLDDSIEKNIAFGEKLDKTKRIRVREAARLANINDWIESLDLKYKSTVGERGIAISGGQRQRIGIARALYKNPSILILDEATSALDPITERLITETIQKLDKLLTIISISHRLPTIKSCDKIVHLKEGKIISEGDFNYLMDNDDDFRNMNLL